MLSFLHHLVRKHLPIFQPHFHKVLPSRQALQAEALQVLALRAHQTALQVV